MPQALPRSAPVRVSADQRFERCEALLVTLEGGYVNAKLDKGGPTNMGVTLAALNDWRGRSCTANDVRCLGAAEVKALYRAVYWAAVQGDALPAGVDLIVFDAAVNCGRGRAVTFLQVGLGMLADGALGPKTLAALSVTVDVVALVERIRRARAAYYASLKTYPTFGTGWNRRLATVAATATSWATKA